MRKLTAWKERMATTRIVAVYALLGGLWILFSDTVMGFITRDPDPLGRISAIKGPAVILMVGIRAAHQVVVITPGKLRGHP